MPPLVAFQAILFLLSISGATSRRLVANDAEVFNMSLDYDGTNHFAQVGLGTPPQFHKLLIDTGSDITWAQCQPTLFDPTASTSYADVGCEDLTCYKVDKSDRGCDDRNKCTYSIEYADGSNTGGTMATEKISFGGVTVPNVPFGCAHWTQGEINQVHGLMGLGSGSLSFLSQSGGQIGRVFSYCLSSSYPYGWLGFGRADVPRGAKWAAMIHSIARPSFYYIELVGISLGGEVLDIPADLFRLSPDTGKGGVILDTGTMVTQLPQGAYEVLRDKFKGMMDSLPLLEGGYSILDTCYNLNGIDLNTVTVPSVSYTFSSHGMDPSTINLDLKPGNILYEADGESSTYCLAFAPTSQSLSIIGNMHQQGTQITIDTSGGFIGFGPGVC